MPDGDDRPGRNWLGDLLLDLALLVLIGQSDRLVEMLIDGWHTLARRLSRPHA